MTESIREVVERVSEFVALICECESKMLSVSCSKLDETRCSFFDALCNPDHVPNDSLEDCMRGFNCSDVGIVFSVVEMGHRSFTFDGP